MKPTYKILGLLLVTALLSACAGYGHVKATANRFHELSTDHNGATIAILPANKNVSESLEFKAYRQKLATYLSTEGFVVVSFLQFSKASCLA